MQVETIQAHHASSGTANEQRRQSWLQYCQRHYHPGYNHCANTLGCNTTEISSRQGPSDHRSSNKGDTSQLPKLQLSGTACRAQGLLEPNNFHAYVLQTYQTSYRSTYEGTHSCFIFFWQRKLSNVLNTFRSLVSLNLPTHSRALSLWQPKPYIHKALIPS